MKQSEAARILELLTHLTEAVVGPTPVRPRTEAGPSLSERVDDRFDRVDKRFGAIDVQFKRVDRRFDQVDQKIESARVEIVDLVERVHDEVTLRVVDLEKGGPGRKGNGGRGSGGGGVPLMS